MEQELDPAGSTRDAQEEAEQPNPGALISHLHLYKGFISQSDFIFSPESKRKLTGVWLFLRKLIPIFIPIHCCDRKLFKQRQNKWQCLGAPGIYSTKMKVNLSNWSKASSVATGGFRCSLCSRFLPWQKELRGGRVLGTCLGAGEAWLYPTAEAPDPKEDVNEA